MTPGRRRTDTAPLHFTLIPDEADKLSNLLTREVYDSGGQI